MISALGTPPPALKGDWKSWKSEENSKPSGLPHCWEWPEYSEETRRPHETYCLLDSIERPLAYTGVKNSQGVWRARHCPQTFGSGSRGLGNKKTSGDHLDYNIVEIGQNTGWNNKIVALEKTTWFHFRLMKTGFLFFVAAHLLVGQLCTNPKRDWGFYYVWKWHNVQRARSEIHRCITHALYRSKLWQQDHCQHPQNANLDCHE